MTLIKAEAVPELKQAQPAEFKLAIGAKLIADVIGPTRHGLAVRVGSEEFLLKARSDLPDAKDLIFKVTGRTSGRVHSIQVLASNDRQLAKPILGELASRSPVPPSQPASMTLVRDPQIEVSARPVTSDGKVLGPPLVVRLTTLPAASALEAHPPSPPKIAPGLTHAQHGARTSVEQRPATSVSTSASATFSPSTNTKETAASPPLTLMTETRTVAPASQQPSAPATDLSPRDAALMQPAVSNREAKGLINATVVGRTSDGGKILLQVADHGLMKIEQPIDLPLGATLQMTLITKAAIGAFLAPADLSADRGDPLSKLIDLLNEIDQSGRGSGDHGEPVAARQLPQPDRNLAAKLLQMMGLQMGSVDKAPTMSQDRDIGGSSKIQQLQSLLSEIGNAASEPLADGWRSTILPLGVDPAQALTIHYRDHRLDPEADSGEDGKDTDDGAVKRAVFDINFSRLGRFQLDVLCQEQRFDLLVRSAEPLDTTGQQVITGLFSSACEVAGLNGEIGYRQGQFVEPAKFPISTKTVMT